ncbi:unnamed protein product [Trifolium pratense]|uniref:Uncharacterized protein n=1 Tax=Trifolium pratense TaxID=57577 RepID=A0ACB0KNA6_TRIPR|nr:unnamed protein product [Trifolium pratense]
MSSEASSSGGVDPPPQSLETSRLVNVPIFSSPAISNVHDVIPTLPIPTMAIPSVTAGPGRSKPPSGQNFMYGPPPTLGLGMPVFESDSRIADFFGTPPPPPRVNPVTPQVILPAMSSTPVQQRPTYVANETVPNPTPTPVVQEETHYPHEVNQMPQVVNQNPPVVNPNPQVVHQNPPVVMVRRNQDPDEVVREVQNNNLLGQHNLANMVETILAQNGLNTGCRRPNFVSAFNEYVLQTELPRGWKVPKYTKFAGDTNESTVEHIARYLAESGNLANNENLRMKYFPNSLTKNAFTWFTTLPPNLIHSWAQLERIFHEQFYMGQTKISLKELASVKRNNQESIDDYLNRFRLLKSRCFTQVPEHELVEMAAGGLDYSIRKKLDTQYLRDMSQLADRVRQIERLKAEKARNSKFQKKKEIGFVDSYDNEIDYEISDEYLEFDDSDINVAELKPGPPYTCKLLRPSNGKNPVEPKNDKFVTKTYTFDITKCDEIFDLLVTDGQIIVPKDMKIPPIEQRKKRGYCKFHNYLGHKTYQCVVFRDLVQKALNEGRLKYADKAKPPMKVDSDPLLPADATYVEVYDCNMVEVIDAAAPVKAVPEEEYEKRVREVYPNAEEELVDFLNRCKLKNAEVMLCPRCSAVCDKEATAGLQNVGSKVVAGKETVNAATEVNKYSYRNNYKGKNPMTRTQWRRFQRKQKLTAKDAEARGKVVATQKAEKVEMTKRPAKERLSIVLEEPIVENAQEGAEGEDDMEDDDLLDEGSDFDVMVNVVSILPLEYDVPTEVNELEEDFEALNLADHKPMCYYVMQNGCVEEQKAVFEKPDLGMQNHLKALFIRAKVNNVGINKVLVDGGAVVNIMPHFMLKKLGLYDTDLHSHNVVLANYEGKTGHSLGAVQLEVCVGSTVRKTLFMVIAAKPNYNLLLGREWIHGVGAVPSTMHQRLIIWREDGLVENVEVDQSAYVSETGTVTLQNFDKNLASIAPCGEQDAAFDPNEVVSKNVYHSCLDGSTIMSMMIESPAWDRITAYAAENRIKMALEAINVQKDMAVEANGDLRDELALEASEVNDGKKQRLDCIYDDEPLGFEKDPHSSIQRMQAQDPLQEVDIGDGSIKKPTYISANIDPTLKERMVELLKKYRDCFAWDYNEMPGLSRNLVEHRLPLRPDKKPVKQLPRRFAPEIMTKIKAEIERLLKCKFIRTTRYVEWLANIVPVIKKNGSLRVCIDFRDLNNATPKDEYSMPVAEMLVDSAAGHEYLSMLDGYSGYNQIFIDEDDVPKTAFRCPGALGTYEWVVMPFGLKNAGATYQRAMNLIFHDFIEIFMQVYIDDIVVKSSSQDEHIEHLKKSFERMRKCGLKMNPLKCVFCVHAGDFLGFVVHKKGIEINQNKTKAIMETKPPGTKKQLQSLLGKINFLRRFISNLSGKAQPFSPLLRLKKGDVFEWGTEQQKTFDDIKAYLSKPPTLMPPIRNKAMKLYVAASDSTIGSMLAQEDENGVEKAIYYQSRILNDAETRYSSIEKLCLCLYFSCTKLKQYIKPVHVYVYSHFDIIKHMLLKPILHSRIGKWALALTEYSLTYQPLRAVKGQIVADFLVDHSVVEIPITYVESEPWVLYFDGSKHKHGTGIGILIISPLKIPTKFKYKINGTCSNNEAEYEALIAGKRLDELVEIKEKLISCEVIPHQLGANEQSVEMESEMADAHFDEVMAEIFVIDNLADNDWRQPIVKYIENPTGTADRKVKYRALSYTIMGNELFKKTPEGVLLKCLNENEAYVAISNAHSGACGAHQAGHKMKWLLFRQGLYWPSMLKDCIEYAKGCQECQKHAGIQHVPASELHSIIKPWPFRGWALDLIGEIRPASSKNQRYILVGIDYFTKWIEAVALTNVDQETVINFIQNHIIYRFGLPETITTDQGTVFVGRKMQDFAEQSCFKLMTSTPYYAQANGQVEAANKVIIGLIKKHVAQKPKNWHKTLDQVLWACRNSPKESTGSTPFRLTYGHDAMLPVEIMMQSIRVQRQWELPPDHYWNLMLDELTDVDEERLQALDALIRQKERIAKAYNKRVKSKLFDVGDLVWKVILPMDRRDRVFGKWSPNWEGPFKISQVLSNGAYEIEELTPEKRSVNMNDKYLKKYKPMLQEICIKSE